MTTNTTLEKLLATEVPPDIMRIAQTHPFFKKILQILQTIPANREKLRDMPLWLLEDLEAIAICYKMGEHFMIVKEAIKANLNAQQRAERAEQWARGLKNLRQSIESRLSTTQTSEN